MHMETKTKILPVIWYIGDLPNFVQRNEISYNANDESSDSLFQGYILKSYIFITKASIA